MTNNTVQKFKELSINKNDESPSIDVFELIMNKEFNSGPKQILQENDDKSLLSKRRPSPTYENNSTNSNQQVLNTNNITNVKESGLCQLSKKNQEKSSSISKSTSVDENDNMKDIMKNFLEESNNLRFKDLSAPKRNNGVILNNNYSQDVKFPNSSSVNMKAKHNNAFMIPEKVMGKFNINNTFCIDEPYNICSEDLKMLLNDDTD